MADPNQPNPSEATLSPVPQELPIPKVGDSGGGDTSAFESGSRLNLAPIGVSGTEIFAGYFAEEYLQELRGRKGAKVWDEIRRSETQVAMLLAAIMNPIKSGTWEFEAADADLVPNAELHKEFVEYNAFECIDWETHIHEALTFLIFGFSVFEVINNIVFNHEKFGTFNGLKALAFRSQKTIERWIVDRGTGDLNTVVQWVQGDLALDRSALIEMPAKFLLVFTAQKEGDNYEGISALRPMYGSWFRKNLYLKISAIGIERNALGTPIGTMPPGKIDPDQLAKFKELLSNFTANESSYLIKPSGWEVEIINNNFDPAKVKEIVLLENTEMINSVVANFLALGTNGGGGAYALGSDLSDFFLDGIVNYANLITGVWNRKLIPRLIRMNYGPQRAYPKLKVSQINDKAGKELADVIQVLTEVQAVKPDEKLEEFLRRIFKLPKIDSTTTRQPLPKGVQPNIPGSTPATPAPVAGPQALLSEGQLKLAESYRKQWDQNKDELKSLMQQHLTGVVDDLKGQIQRQYKSATPKGRASLAMKIQPRTGAYKKALQEALAKIATKAMAAAQKETPKAKNVKLAENIKLAAPVGGYFDALPDKIKSIVKTQAGLIADTQAADLDKVVSFQYTHSQASTQDLDQVLLDITQATQPVVEGSTQTGMSVDAAAGNAVSSIVNQARNVWFFDPEVLNTIESFTFFNEAPVSAICRELNGTTWAVGDSDLDRYSPPLHHNCKSRLVPNQKGADNNPEIANGTPVTQKALDSITLCECDFHLNFQMVEPK